MAASKLDSKTLRELFAVLSPHCQSPAHRRALFVMAIGEHPVLDSLDYEEEVSVFLPNAITRLHAAGELEPGKTAVVLILSLVRERVGADVQASIDELVARLSPSFVVDVKLAKLFKMLEEAEAKEAWGAVIELGENILELEPLHPEAKDRLASAYFWRAAPVVNTQQRPNAADLKRALADFDRAIDLQPMRAEYYRWRGAAYFWLGDLSEAINDQTTAITLDPTNADYYQNRGASYFERAEYARALIDCNRAIELDATQADFFLSRGRVYQKMGKRDEARADYQQAADLGSELAAVALKAL
jgi:tetratricopeptide (TPR) repeat protein